jgi:antitoxin component HigA of HigAB toxin-antitoxin module
MTLTKLKFADIPKDYSGLVAMYPPRPLHDEVDERNVEEIVNVMAGHALTVDQEDYLDLLSDLLLKHHAEHHSPRRGPRSPANRLQYLMAQSETTPTQLARILRCSQPLVSLILGGKRELSKANVKKLANHFKLDAGYFL